MEGVDRARDGAYDDLLDAIAAGEGYYLECGNGHGWLPPRRICPECGSREFAAEPLPESGEVVTFTEIAIGAPSWTDEAPYVTTIVDFGPVSITGLFRGPGEPEIGTTVRIDVGERATADERAIVFRTS